MNSRESTSETPKETRGRRNRRVTAPGTSGQSEEAESGAYDPLNSERTRAEEGTEQRAEWLRSEKPPHWGH
jgi:hypothetical protein